MKQILILISSLVIFWSMLCAAPAERVLSLEESVATGLHNSQKYLAVQEEISLAQQRISEATALTYPKMDLNINMMQFHNNSPSILTPELGSVFLPGTNKDQYYYTRVTMYQYLYAGGRYRTTIRVADANLSQAQSQAEVIKNEVISEVKKAYITLLIAKTKKENYEKAYEELKKTNRLKSGGRDFALSLGKVTHDYEKAKLAHLKALGLELNTLVDIKGIVVPPDTEYDLNKCLAWAKQYRPELRQTQYQEAIDSLKVSLSVTERYPTVTLGANYEWLGEQYPMTDKNWNAVINVNIPIFDGWALWSRIKQKKIKMRENKIFLAAAEDQIELEVREAHLDYSYWRQRMNVTETAKPNEQDVLKKLEISDSWLETMENLLKSNVQIEWATGVAINGKK